MFSCLGNYKKVMPKWQNSTKTDARVIALTVCKCFWHYDNGQPFFFTPQINCFNCTLYFLYFFFFLVIIFVPAWNHVCWHQGAWGGLPAGFHARWWFQLCLSCFFKATDCFHNLKRDFLPRRTDKAGHLNMFPISSQIFFPLFGGEGDTKTSLHTHRLAGCVVGSNASVGQVGLLMVCPGKSLMEIIFRSFHLRTDWCVSTAFVIVLESWHLCVSVCVCTVDILTCHHRMLLHATKAVLFGPWSNNYRVSLASVASWNLLVKSDILK